MRWFSSAALPLGLCLLLQGCCPGPQALASGTWARTRTGVEPALKSDEGKPLPRGQYALQVFLQGPEDSYPTLAQVDLVVTGCEFY